MNLIYAGNISTFSPISYMDRTKMTLIRPLIYVPEKQTKSLIKQEGFKTMPKVCPLDGNSSREYALNLLKGLEMTYKYTRANIMGAIKRARINGWKEIKG